MADDVFDPEVEDEMLQGLLDFDPLRAAEDHFGGVDYQDSPQAQALGFQLMQNAHRMREEALTARGDTTFRNDVTRYLGIIEADGFEEVYKVPFAGHDGRPEMFYVYFHYRDGILLEFDTYGTDGINDGSAYYNWLPNPALEAPVWWRATSSGHFQNYDDPELRVWVGMHDCREALIFNLTKLRTLGTFVTPWKGDPLIALNHHGDKPKAHYGSPEYVEGMKLYHAASTFRIKTQLPRELLDVIRFCEDCGKFDLTTNLRHCGYHAEVSGRAWPEVVCDSCEVSHNRDA